LESSNEKLWHALSVSEVIGQLDSNLEKGLEASVAEQRLRDHGPNTIPERRGQSPLVRFLLQFHQPLIYLLLAVGVVTFVLKDWVDALVILGVVVINAIIGFVQESKAVKAIAALAKSLETSARVVRSGEVRVVSASQIVPGDMVLLGSGDRVPADLRLLKVKDLQAAEAALTGESQAVEKSAETLDESVGLADRRNLAFCSSLVTYGSATGVVIATGRHTEIGKISDMIASSPDLKTPLTNKMEKFSHGLLLVVIGLALVTFVVGVWRGEPIVEMFKAAVALAVGAVPEGLPAALTIILAIGVGRMAKRHAIIRKLPAVETLGSTTIICSDKTGTLTQNRMTVREAFAGGHRVLLDQSNTTSGSNGFVTDAVSGDVADNQALKSCLLVGELCNDSQLVEKDGEMVVQGDPTETALLMASRKLESTIPSQASQWVRVDAIPFESQHQYMATLHQSTHNPSNVHWLLSIKGAPERVLDHCRHQMNSDGSLAPIDRSNVLKQVERLSRQGMRVLAMAMTQQTNHDQPLTHETVGNELTFVGLQALIDPPRSEARDAIAECQAAGVQVKMITGDHLLTAVAIANELGINGPRTVDGQLYAVAGKELQQIPDDQLSEVAQRTSVFARVSPEQKLRLVQALQKQGHIVAMTGDGVNDAPALRQANIGIAMGITGTEVSKEAAHVVLTDDNFATIEAAVEEGRGVFDNLTKVIVWTLPTNLGEGLVIFVAILAGLTLPITPLQILWINMTTAVLLGLMLAFEPKEPNIMRRHPRDPKASILTPTLIGRIVLVGFLLLLGSFGLFQWCLGNGLSIEAARTVSVNVFVIASMFYLVNCRSLTRSIFQLGIHSNPWIGLGMLLTVLTQLAFTYLPVMNNIFESAPIGWKEWGAVVAVSVMVYIVVGIEKGIRSWMSTKESRLQSTSQLHKGDRSLAA
jgi:cation-transporting P-type ATPase F